MSVDWKLLAQVRDRQAVAAQKHVARERLVSQQRAAQVLQAETELKSHVVTKMRLWQSTIDCRAEGFSVDELRQASVWSRKLDACIAQAAETMRQAQQQAAQQQTRLDASRQQLRAAAGDLKKAEEMGLRLRTEQLHRTETRLDEAAEEAASQTWAARKASQQAY